MYYYNGIETNNLKNISIDFDDHNIVYIGGVSGSGKSSLAFDTIAAISDNEYNCIIKDNKIDLKYRVKDYGNVLVASALKQLNFNINPRSIVLTYFGLQRHLFYIFSQYTKKSIKEFSLNGPNRCKECNGIGYTNKVDELLVIDQCKSIRENPFQCWKGVHFEFFSKLLHNFCVDNGIDENKKIGELTVQNRKLLLYGKSEKKYKIEYKGGGRKRIKTSAYIGPVIGLMESKDDIFSNGADKYSKKSICAGCKGSRLNIDISEKKVYGKYNVEFFLTKSLSEVKEALLFINSRCRNKFMSHSCEALIRFIIACEKLNISYINFSRSISSLSGGELQRLRIAQLLIGKLNNLLIVLDEPTSSLDAYEIKNVLKSIKEIKKHNTLIVIDHNDKTMNIADKMYFLGPKGGMEGGQLISKLDYVKSQDVKPIIVKKQTADEVEVRLISDYVSYLNNYRIRLNSLNCICGPSGIGKTIVLRDVLPYQLEKYKYITQKPIKANRNSTVATFTGLNEEIEKYFSKKLKKDRKIFSNKSKGACKKCKGSGKVMVGDLYDEEIFTECEQCHGTGYLKGVLELKVDKRNIYEFLNLSVNMIIKNKISISKKFDSTIGVLGKLGLGHLLLNQKVSTLSGGENQRIKLSQSMYDSKYKIFGLDEPAKGLGKREILDLVTIIYENICNYNKTYVVVEHNEFFIKMCQFVSLLKKDKGAVKIVDIDHL